MSPLSFETEYNSEKKPSIISSSLKNDNICMCEASASLGQHVVIILSSHSKSSDVEIL